MGRWLVSRLFRDALEEGAGEPVTAGLLDASPCPPFSIHGRGHVNTTPSARAAR
jgi:hypothetical protein